MLGFRSLGRFIHASSPSDPHAASNEQISIGRAIAWYNAGVYIFRPVVFDFTARLQKSPRNEYELTDAISSMVQAGHRIAGLEIQGRWVDVRDPQVLAELERNPQK